jgi:hypothetical protein
VPTGVVTKTSLGGDGVRSMSSTRAERQRSRHHGPRRPRTRTPSTC